MMLRAGLVVVALVARVALVALLCVSVAHGGDRAELLRCLRDGLDSAGSAVAAGELERAAALYLQARRDAESLKTPNLPLARAIDGLADVRRLQGELDQAAVLYRSVLPMWEQLLGPGQPRLATSLNNLAVVHIRRGEPRLAAPLLDRAIAIWEIRLGPDALETAEARRMRGALPCP